MPSYTMADKQDTKDEITPVGPGADEDLQSGAARTDDRAGDDYQYPEGDDEDSPGRNEASDERTGHAENDDQDDNAGLSREQKRRRRKREKYERDQRELALLRSRNEQLEREHSRRLADMESRQTQSDVLAIDGRIAQAESSIREAESLYTQALKVNDADAATEALRVRDTFRDNLQALRGAKQQTVQTARARRAESTQAPAIDPAIVSRAQEWARERSWFDPALRDEDSVIAQAIERRLFAEGRLDPSSEEYWDEVDRRISKRLPERYADSRADREDEDEYDSPPRRVNGKTNTNGQRKPSGPTIKVGGRERTLRKGEVYIDEDRKQAMIEAGVWDDPKERERFMRSYQKYDRDAGRRPR